MVIIDILVSARVFSLIGDSLRERISSGLIEIFSEINTPYSVRLRKFFGHKWAVKWSVYPEGKNMPSMIIIIDLSFVDDVTCASIPKGFPLENNLISPARTFFDGLLGLNKALAEILKNKIMIRVKR